MTIVSVEQLNELLTVLDLAVRAVMISLFVTDELSEIGATYEGNEEAMLAVDEKAAACLVESGSCWVMVWLEEDEEDMV